MTTAQFSDKSVQQSIQEFITKSDNIQTELSFGQSVVKVIQSSEANYQSFHKTELPENVDDWTTDELYEFLSDEYGLTELTNEQD